MQKVFQKSKYSLPSSEEELARQAHRHKRCCRGHLQPPTLPATSRIPSLFVAVSVENQQTARSLARSLAIQTFSKFWFFFFFSSQIDLDRKDLIAKKHYNSSKSIFREKIAPFGLIISQATDWASTLGFLLNPVASKLAIFWRKTDEEDQLHYCVQPNLRNFLREISGFFVFYAILRTQ